MRESDNFALRPERRIRKVATAYRQVRAWAGYVVRGWLGVGNACLLLVTAAGILAVAWTALSVATAHRAVAAARSRWEGRYRARHRHPVRVPTLVAPGRHRLVVAAGRHRGPGLSLVLGFEGRHRSAPSPRPALTTVMLRAASWRPRIPRLGAGWVRSRRLSAVLATILSVLVLGGLLPASAAPNDITTVAGRPDSGDGGPATGALLHLPQDVAVDSAGNVFIADTYNHRIRRVSTTGIITTVAGNGTSGSSGDGGSATAAQLRFPEGVWVDGGGNVFIADTGNHRVRMVDTSGTIATVAGTGTRGFSGDGGPATAAALNNPKDVTTDGSGNLYIADTRNHRIRRVGGAGIITTFAGNGIQGYAGDGGPATDARLNDPTGVVYGNASGNLFIADRDNHRIRRVDAAGTITKYAGNGTAGSSGDGRNKDHPQVELNSPSRVALGSSGLFIADTKNHKIRFINSSDVINTVAGSGAAGFSGDGGGATGARLDDPAGVAAGGPGALPFYVADSDNHRVRHVSSGTITTFAGKSHYGGDGGPATDAALNRPHGVTTDGAGNILVADTENHRLRRISGGVISTVAGTGVVGFSGDGGAATSARLNSPYDAAVDGAGNTYISDTFNNRIRKVDPAGNISTFAGTGWAGYWGDGGPATLADLFWPTGVEVDAAGNLYIADWGNHRIRKVDTSGTITTVAGNGTGSFCGDGGAATSACIENPTDVEVDGDGDFYIADYSNHRIRKVTAGTIRTVAGNGSSSHSGDGGAATSAGLGAPVGVAVDGAGNILLSSARGLRIRRVDLSGIITTVAGTGSFGFSGDGGPATSGEMTLPTRIALDGAGNLYIADSYNSRIRMVEEVGALPGPTMDGTSPASPANENSPLVFGTAEAGTTVRIYTDSACTGTIAATGTDSEFASPGLAVSVPDDSTTSFYATATDGSGQVSACSMTSVTYIEDSTPPGPPTITLEPASPGSDLTPSWSFTVDAGATAECELVRGTTVLSAYAPCTSPTTYDLTGEPDGSYTFSVRATDAAGNTGSAASDTYVLDSTASDAPTISSSPSTPSNDLFPTWEFTVETGSTAECEWSYEGTVLQAFAPCTSPQSFDLTGEPDGKYTYRVQARDGAGNVSAPVSSEYTLDTTDPAAPSIDSGPTSPGSSTSPSWSFSVEAGSTPECELSSGGTIVSAWAPCSSPKTYDLSGAPDGVYDFRVRAVDAASNTGPTTASSYTLDTTGPVVDITSSPATPDSDPNPSWSFSTEAGASLECELVQGEVVVSAWATCSSPATYDLSAQPDGDYTFSARATDSTGNTGDPAGSVYVLDRTAPVVTIDSAPAPVSSDQTPEWSFSSDAGVTFECQLSGSSGVLQPFTACASPQSYDLTGQPDGTYTFSVRGTDVAGNLGPESASGYVVDTSGPTVDITSSPDSPGNNRAPSWSFTAEAGATTECQLSSGAAVLSDWAPCASPASYDLTGQPDGAYTFSVRATDPAGNLGAPAGNTYTLDTTAPAASITSAPTSPGTSRMPSWSFTTESGASTECELTRGGVVVSAWQLCLSPATYSLDGQPDGDYTFRVRATDGAGNTGPVDANTYTLDTTGPAVNINSPESPSNDRTPTWTFSTDRSATTECELSSGAGVLQPFAPCSSPVTYDLAGGADGDYTLRVRATDVAGNIGPIASSTYVLDTSGPATAIVGGPASPGSTVNPSWAFTTEAGATTECELARGQVVVRSFASCHSPHAFDLTGEPDGDYTFRVRATDTSGNTGPVATSTYTLDTTPPAPPVITAWPASPDTASSVAWSFTSDPGASTECELTRGGTVIQGFGPCTSPRAYDLTGPDGDYTFSVRAMDGLGNASAPATSAYVLDITGPGVKFTSEPKSPGKLRNPTWEFTVEAGAKVECSLSLGGNRVDADASCVSPVSFDLRGEPDGTYTLRVTARDSIGNVGPTASSKYELRTTEGGDGELAPAPARPPAASQPVAEPEREPEADSTAPQTDRPERRDDRSTGDRQADPGEERELVPPPEEVREVSEGSVRRRGALGEFLQNVGTVAASLIEQPAFPLSLMSVVFGFLVLQNRVDRRDPKLAMAPVYPDPHLYFEPQEEPGKGLSSSGADVKGPMK